ncbi:MAG: hypothetical protein K8T10_02920 [Candidatus Eremiobacteraeota bacterium]|nr:hypothetical protein [Candidatus Eremiobacteraeota bacterium]
MEIRNTTRFLVLTIFLVIAMVAITYMFSHHPMGADFSRFQILTAENLENPGALNGQRVSVRGKVTKAEPDKFIQRLPKNVIGYIEKEVDPTAGKKGKEKYLNFETNDFNVQIGEGAILVQGQPEQIIDIKNKIQNPIIPNRSVETIRQGNEYSVFGNIIQNQSGKFVLKPYRVTTQDIKSVQEEAIKESKKSTFIQYLSIFAIIIIYIIAMWKLDIFGPPRPEEEESDEEKDEEKSENPEGREENSEDSEADKKED